MFIIPADFIFSSSSSHSNNTRDTHAKKIFCFNNNVMNDNSKQDHPGRNKFGCTLFPELRRHYPARIFRLFLNTQKNPYLNQLNQKNSCQIFLHKKIAESKIPNLKKSFDHPRHLKSGVPPPGGVTTIILETAFLCNALINLGKS